MKTILPLVAVLVLTDCLNASQTGTLPFDDVTIRAHGVDASDEIVVHATQAPGSPMIEVRVRAFGRETIVPIDRQKYLFGSAATGIRCGQISAGLGSANGRTIVLEIQAGMDGELSVLVSVSEDGTSGIVKYGLLEKMEKAAQPGATDNPGDAQ